MNVATLPGVAATTVTTGRIRTRVLTTGPADGVPVLFIHGNLSSATWWEETMLALPARFRGLAPDQRGYGEADPEAKVDATRGVADLADDAIALLNHLGVDRAHLVGNSLGGIVVWRLLGAHPERWLTVTQVDPGSPYGFGGTKDPAGTPCYDDYAGSGAGLINPQVVERLAAGDRTADDPFTARSALRQLIVKPPFIPPREDDLVDAMLTTHLGEQDYAGDLVQSANWPFVAPGVWGPNNALSPKYVGEATAVIGADPKPPILWARGRHDLLVSDASVADIGTLGPTGVIPGYPGPDVFPSQPMVSQIQAMLSSYEQEGGSYEEVVFEDSGHVPFIERPDEFNEVFHRHIGTTSRGGEG